MEELFNFLVEAKRHTIAADNDDCLVVGDTPNTLEYEYRQNDLIYSDIHYGENKFIGQEIVYKNGVPLWGNNYYGLVLDESVRKDIDIVLKKAFKLVGDQLYMPIRGPRELEDGPYKYTCDITGGLEFFSGTESIFKNGKRVYVLRLNGGKIK